MNPEKIETIKALLGTIGFLFVLLPIVLVLIPFQILSSSNHLNISDLGEFRYFGLAPIFVGVVIIFLCSYRFVIFGKGTPIRTMPPKKLVVTGLYRFVRNPMGIGGILVLAGEVLLFQSKGLLIYFLIMFGYINLMILAVEEPRLKKRFGDPYERYCKSVRRWIPRLSPYRENDLESR